MKTKHLVLLRLQTKLMSWVAKWWFPECSDYASGAITRWHRYFKISVKSRGVPGTISKLKELRGKLIWHTAHLDEDGPKYIPYIFPYSMRTRIRKGDRSAIRLGLTILSLGRAWVQAGTPDLEPILKPSSSTMDLSKFMDWVKSERALNLFPIHIEWEKSHFSVKSGPKGPAMLTSIADYFSLPVSLKESILTLGEDRLRMKFAWIDNNVDGALKDWLITKGVKKGRESLIRVLSVRQDREMKLRPFAILDYWSQAALKPLHDALFRVLKNTECDWTFNQLAGVEYLKGIVPDSKYWSLDLVSATDRFPVDIQHQVLIGLIGQEKADAWKSIMVDYPFTLITSTGSQEVKYGAGQPMGAYSSWALFTLTHHLLVRYAANDSNYTRYAILGDDIVICDDQVATNYIKIMNSLGVDIAPSKTLVSKDTFEFAKRLISRGVNLSPFPVSGLKEVVKVPTLLYLFLITEVRGREFPFNPRSLLNRSIIRDLYNRLSVPIWRIDKILWKHWYKAVRFPFTGEDLTGDFSAREFMLASGYDPGCNRSETWCREVLAEFSAGAYANLFRDSLVKGQQRLVETLQGIPNVVKEKGGPEGLDASMLQGLPMIEGNIGLFQDYAGLLERFRSYLSQGDFLRIFQDRVAIYVADPKWIFDGSRTRVILGATARLIERTSKLLKWRVDDELLALQSPDDDETPKDALDYK